MEKYSMITFHFSISNLINSSIMQMEKKNLTYGYDFCIVLIFLSPPFFMPSPLVIRILRGYIDPCFSLHIHDFSKFVIENLPVHPVSVIVLYCFQGIMSKHNKNDFWIKFKMNIIR